MKKLITILFFFSSSIYSQVSDVEVFIWNYSVTITSSYERYYKEFEDSVRNIAALDLIEVREEDILKINDKYYIIKRPQPSFHGYIIWLNNWIKKREESN
jgi:hypothetical protein